MCLMEDGLASKIMIEFRDPNLEIYSYLTDYGYVDKKAKSIRKYMIKREIKLQN